MDQDLALELARARHEAKSWERYATAQARVQTLGEIAALVAHDLSGPMHSFQMFLNELKDNPEGVVHDQELIDLIFESMKQSVELIQSIKMSLKGPLSAESEPQTSFRQVYREVIRRFSRVETVIPVKFTLEGLEEPSLDFKLGLSRLDSLLILNNLFSNAVKELVECGVSSPRVVTKLKVINSDFVEIQIMDNGRGMSSERFELLTSDKILFEQGYYGSLGLRLTRKLVESKGGSLSLETNQERNSSGACLVLRIQGKSKVAV